MSRWIRWVCALLFCGGVAAPGQAQAALPYETYSFDSNGSRFPVQAAYIPERMIGLESGELRFDSPEDIMIDDRNQLYVVDSRNNRVVRLNENYEQTIVYGDEEGDGELKRPEGVFVTKEGFVYVADTGNRRVALFQADGTYIREYRKPDSEYLPDNFRFEPMKLVVDQRGVMYLVLKSGYQGLMLIDTKDGQFRGFFGMNQASYHFIDALKRLFFTEAQMSMEGDKLPGTISNVTIDDQGLIYTSSVRVPTRQLKKLNYAGADLLGDRVYGEKRLKAGQERMFTDLTVDRSGMIAAVDNQTGIIYQYDSDGEILFAFAGKDEGFRKLGLLEQPKAIEVDANGKLYVVDSGANAVYVFRPSDFALKVMEAKRLTLDGKYRESEELWNEVLHLNSKYYLAHLGIGKSYYSQGMWEQAMDHFKAANAVTEYSKAFWQVRLNFMQSHFTLIVTVLLASAIAIYAIRRLLDRRVADLLSRYGNSLAMVQLKGLFRLLKHPFDGFAELRYHRKSGLLASVVLLALLYVMLIASELASSFIFNPRETNDVDPLVVLAVLLVLFATWVVCNYLISSIFRGQGRFVDVVIGSSYALTPYALLIFPITLVSNALTLGESAIYSFLTVGALCWTGFLFVVCVKEIHNFDLGEAIRIIVLTILFALAVWILLFIFFGMNVQLFDFITQVREELKFRA
ncbi:YIP1 family protein [Cohnella sp.]|uniref:YIP1 family protein n=1 Tax=Cohnella sp. TaxID=1883426 RepID=UPI003564A62D